MGEGKNIPILIEGWGIEEEVEDMKKWYDNLLCWHGWTIIKYPFGLFILWFVLFVIYNMEINPKWDKQVVNDLSKYRPSFKIDLRNILSTPSSPIKNLKP